MTHRRHRIPNSHQTPRRKQRDIKSKFTKQRTAFELGPSPDLFRQIGMGLKKVWLKNADRLAVPGSLIVAQAYDAQPKACCDEGGPKDRRIGETRHLALDSSEHLILHSHWHPIKDSER